MVLSTVALLAAMTGCNSEGGADAVVADEPKPSDQGPQIDERQTAIRDGRMPDLTGSTLNELGDETGVLYALQDRIGMQDTRNVPNADHPVGVVFEQSPASGTPLAEVTSWSVAVSAGGPVITYDDLPPEVAEFAASLDRLDDELLVERVTDLGTVYKSENWLFGLDCEAVDAAYRTFLDSRYDTACPNDSSNEPSS